MWEISRDTTVVAAWHGPEDEPWTMEALRDVQQDMEMPDIYIEKNWTLDCYKKRIYSCLEPKPIIERFTLINQLFLSRKNLARMEIVVQGLKNYSVVKDELSALVEEGDIERVRIVRLPKCLRMFSGLEYWILISLPKPSVDPAKTKASTCLLFNMIHRLQGLDHYRDKGVTNPLMPKLYHYYRLEDYRSVILESTILACKRLNLTSVSEVQNAVSKLTIKESEPKN